MNKLILVSILLLWIKTDADGQNWQPFQGRNGYYRTEVSAIGTTPDGDTPTTLAVQCYPGKRGYVLFNYEVHRVSKVTGFHFTDFEGPDAPMADRRMVTVRVRTKRGDVIAKTTVSGGLTDAETFVFNFGITGNLRGDTRRLIYALKGEASQKSVTVQDSRDNHKFLHTNFPAEDAAKTVTEIMGKCGK